MINYRQYLGQRGSIRAGLFLVASLGVALFSTPFAKADDWSVSDAERIVAIGDVHGAYDALVTTLQQAGVIDQDLAWSGGKTHLVSTGDLLDRGPGSRWAMDLFIRLEDEARRAGGRVHLVLGNHEVMNLIGDLRYVADEEYASFLDMESPEEREKWYRKFRSGWPADSDESKIREEFSEKAPPGFFGHRRAFRPDGLYGQWLLEKPIMVVVNETVFVHGGVPPFVAEHGLEGVNVDLKNDLTAYVGARTALEDAMIMTPWDSFRESADTLAAGRDEGQVPDEFGDTVQTIIESKASPLHNATGPTWYRGTASCNQIIEGDALNRAFDRIGASRVVMGHTYTVTRKVQQRMNGRVVEIDTGMLKSSYNGSGNALIIEGDSLSVINQEGGEVLAPIDHPVRVGHKSLAITDRELETILQTGEIRELSSDGAVWTLVEVKGDSHTVFAYFRALPEDTENLPELAAYKVDRMLGLGMLPVTVRRELAGRPGTLQFVPPDAMTERERSVSDAGGRARCSFEKQISAMHVFDALIQNESRTPSTMIYSRDDWLLVLIDHSSAFSIEDGRPRHLRDVQLAVGDEWRLALSKLDDMSLRTELSTVLGEPQITALQRRRDALIGN